MFALYAAPAMNLFEKTTDRIAVKPKQHEFHVVPDRSRYLDFEPHRILDVYRPLHRAARRSPGLSALFGAARWRVRRAAASLYTLRRAAAAALGRRSANTDAASDYTGTDMFISLTEPAGVDDEPDVAELSVRALCSNRHLTEHLPIGEAGADFRLLDNITLDIVCVAGPTPPREPIVGAAAEPRRDRPHRAR